MTREIRLMLAAQGAADPELAGCDVHRPASVSAAEAMRCKRCGWPIVSDPAKGCTIDSCSCRCESYPQCMCGSSIPLPADPRDTEIAALRAALWEIVGSGGRHSARLARAALAQTGGAT